MQDKFDKLVASIDDAYENNYLTGDGKDQIQNVMCALYKEDAKTFAVRNGDMDESDDFVPMVEIEHIFEETDKKEEFLVHLDAVIYQACKGRMSTSEMVEFIRS